LRQSWLHCPRQALLRSLHKVRDAALDRFLPMGYEDETGFHYGPEPEPGEAETSRNVDLN
jgi:hypothetical protein